MTSTPVPRSLRQRLQDRLPRAGGSSGGVQSVADDQDAALRHLCAVTVVRSRLDRAAVLAAVRHELHLPLLARSVAVGEPYLARADDSSVVVGSLSRRGTRFLGVLVVRDRPGGCVGEYGVASWHTDRGRVCGMEQLRQVRFTVLRGVRAVDPMARIEQAGSTAPAR